MGSAFVVLRTTPTGLAMTPKKFKLDQTCSVFQAELFAIHKGLEWASKHTEANITIYSDSSSSLHAIADRSNPHPLVVAIHQTLSDLGQPRVQFVWVKAHVGIEGNEAADLEAKAAATQRRAKEYTAFPISFAKHRIRQRMQAAWEAEYQSADTGSTTRSFFPTLSAIAAFRSASDTTFEATQVLTGHGFHRSYLKRFHIIQDDTCPCGTGTPQDLDHLLHSCSEYAEARRGYVEACRASGSDAFAMASHGADKPHLVTRFITFITSIVSTLKALNS